MMPSHIWKTQAQRLTDLIRHQTRTNVEGTFDIHFLHCAFRNLSVSMQYFFLFVCFKYFFNVATHQCSQNFWSVLLIKLIKNHISSCSVCFSQGHSEDWSAPQDLDFFFLFKFRRSECRILACTIEMGSNGRDIYLFIYLVNVLSWNTGKSFVLMSEQLNAFIVIKCFICVSKSLNTYAWVTHQLQLQSLNLLLKSVPLGVRNNMLPW